MNSLFGKILCIEILFYYYQLLISIKLKQKMMLSAKITIFEKCLVNSYNYIFLHISA